MWGECSAHRIMRNFIKIKRAALSVNDGDVIRIRKALKRGGRRIFNPDAKRTQAALRQTDTLIARLKTALSKMKLLDNRTITQAVVLHSSAMCKQQQWHYDYDPKVMRDMRVKPLGVILALQDGTKFETVTCTHTLCKGDILVFGGDVVHAGAAYDKENTRVHAYLDVANVKRVRNRTWLAQRDE